GSAGLDANPWVVPASLRLQANGQPDAAYGSGGKVTVAGPPWPGSSFIIHAAARAADGKVVFAGLCQTCGQGGLPDLFALRMTATGQADPTFGEGGWFSFGRVAPDQTWMIEQVQAVAI